MIVLPDLFGAYQKGRETAIEANWNDLKNYETVESMRTRNDRDALQLLADQADYNINRSMMRDNGDVSALNAALAKERFHRDYYNALIDAQVGKAQHAATTEAAAKGQLYDLANNELMTTINNGYTNLHNSGVNSIDAGARFKAIKQHQKAFEQLTADTVDFNIVKGINTNNLGRELMPSENATAKANALATQYLAWVAEAYGRGKAQDLEASEQAGVNATKGNYTASQLVVAANENALFQTQKQREDERKFKLAQLLDRRTSLLQNIRLAAQQGDTATMQAMEEQYAANEADIASLSGKPRPSLASEAVNSVPGVAPITQVPSTPATQPPAQVPTKVPQSLFAGQPTSPTSNLFPKDNWTRIPTSTGAGGPTYSSPVGSRQPTGPGVGRWSSVGYGYPRQ